MPSSIERIPDASAIFVRPTLAQQSEWERRHNLKPDVPHKLSSEVKPGCLIVPVTRIAERPSSPAELADWCNNLARSLGIHQPDPSRPFYYHATPSNFGPIVCRENLSHITGVQP